MDIRTKRLIEAFNNSGMSQTEICEKTGINKGALSSYLCGRYFPKQKNLDLLSRALNVSIPFLMGFDEDEEDKFNLLTNQIKYNKKPCDELIQYIQDLNEEEVQMIIKYILFIKSQR